MRYLMRRRRSNLFWICCWTCWDGWMDYC